TKRAHYHWEGTCLRLRPQRFLLPRFHKSRFWRLWLATGKAGLSQLRQGLNWPAFFRKRRFGVRRLPPHPHPELFRLMRALESIGICKQVSSQVFANTPASDCLRKNLPGSQWAFVRSFLSVGSGQYEAWNGLLGIVQTGKTAFDEMYGCNLWEW